jgi:hypothetical protein
VSRTAIPWSVFNERQQLRETFGPEPDGRCYRITRNAHDFGTYLDVVMEFDPENGTAPDYALKVEANAPGDGNSRSTKISSRP